MLGFISKRNDGRAGSPQNGQPQINPHRQAIAANARVPIAKPGAARPLKAQSGPQLRGENAPSPLPSPSQQQQQLRLSEEGQKRDPYDTDAESLDTTINHSVIQVENSPQDRQQHVQLDRVTAEAGNDEEYYEDEDEDEDDDDEYSFTEAQKKYLKEQGMHGASYTDQFEHLRDAPLYLFPATKGDSYPPTTNGDPTELSEQPREPFEDQNPRSLSPSAQRPYRQGPTAPLSSLQHMQEELTHNVPHVDVVAYQNTKIYRHGAQLREQERGDAALQNRVQASQQQDMAIPPSSQLPTYSQVSRDQGFATPSVPQFRQEFVVQADQVGLPQRIGRPPPTGPGRAQHPVPNILEPVAPLEPAPTALPIIPQYVRPVDVEEPQVYPDGDYDPEVLAGMKYDQLKEESFDVNPRAKGTALSEDMLEKPLVERLQFVQQNFDPANQSEFFNGLPTYEWEDAGDWFLDQFSSIIHRTKSARQTKRKLAQEFEAEVENRHEHVAKKQQFVEGAMAKMKAQGEGLMPKSPRASKSPRPRRG
ncbi:hypothetical protein N0V94_001541 [Neodidymelliopsis sp. IMI 364377]|nr:hypothetical protein N0V94_001541 [Neodidymelliopsis sp. IMI 364377]